MPIAPSLAGVLGLLALLGGGAPSSPPRALEVEVLVVDGETGAPIEGATALLLLASPRSAVLREVASAVTGPEGVARIALPEDAPLRDFEEAFIGADSPRHDFTFDPVAIPALERTPRRRLTLEPGMEGQVRFLDATGLPLPDLDVYLECPVPLGTGHPFSARLRRTRTDASGCAHLRVGERWRLAIADARGRFHGARHGPPPAELRLEPPAPLVPARLLGPAEIAIAGAEILDAVGIPIATTDEMGLFIAPGEASSWTLGSPEWQSFELHTIGKVTIVRAASRRLVRAELRWPDGAMYLGAAPHPGTGYFGRDRGALVWSPNSGDHRSFLLDLSFARPGARWVLDPSGELDLGPQYIHGPPHDSVFVRDADLCDLAGIEVRIVDPAGDEAAPPIPPPPAPRPAGRLGRGGRGGAAVESRAIRLETDAASVARLFGAPPGPAWLEVVEVGFAPIEISAEGGVRHELVLPRSAELRITSSPMVHMEITATIASEPPIWRHTFPCREEVRIRGFPVGLPLELSVGEGDLRRSLRIDPLRPGDSREVSTVSLFPSGSVSGTVVSVDDAPIAGVELSIVSRGTASGRATTDAAGRFEFPQVPVSSGLVLVVESEDYLDPHTFSPRVEAHFTLREGERFEHEFELAPARRARSRLLFPDGLPAPGTRVQVLAEGIPSTVIECEPDGNFALRGAPAGRVVTLIASARPFGELGRFRFAPDDPIPELLELAAVPTVRARIITAPELAPGTRFELARPGERRLAAADVAEGNLLLFRIPPASLPEVSAEAAEPVRYEIRGSTAVSESFPLLLAADSDLAIDLVLSARRRVEFSVRVTDEAGLPLPNSSVRWSPLSVSSHAAERQQAEKTLRTAEDGEVVLSTDAWIPRLEVRPPPQRDDLSSVDIIEPVSRRTGGALEVRLLPKAIVTVDPRWPNGDRIQGVAIALRRTDGSEGFGGSGTRTEREAPIPIRPSLDAGEYDILLHRGQETIHRERRFLSGTVDLVVEVPAAATLEGIVSRGGAPVAGGMIQVVSESSRASDAEVGADGRYRLATTFLGPASIRWFPPPQPREDRTPLPRFPGREIELIPGVWSLDLDFGITRLEGRVTDAEGMPLPAKIRVSGRARGELETNAEGRFLWNDAPHGPVSLAAVPLVAEGVRGTLPIPTLRLRLSAAPVAIEIRAHHCVETRLLVPPAPPGGLEIHRRADAGVEVLARIAEGGTEATLSLPPGTSHLIALGVRPAGAPAGAVAGFGAAIVDPALPPTAPLEIRAAFAVELRCDTAPAAPTPVAIERLDGDPLSWPAGTFRFAGKRETVHLPAGRYRLRIEDPALGTREATIEVPPAGFPEGIPGLELRPPAAPGEGN